MCGDFLQIKAIGGQLYYGRSTLQGSLTSDIDDANVTELTTQHRAAGTDKRNAEHRDILNDLRDPQKSREAWTRFLKVTPESTKIESDAVVIVLTNDERLAFTASSMSDVKLPCKVLRP